MTSDEAPGDAVDTLIARLQETITREVREAATQMAARLTPLNPARDDASGAHPLPGVRAIDAARSLSGVLDALVDAVAEDGVRVAVLLVRAPLLRNWRDRGFDEPLSAVDVALDPTGPIAAALRTKTVVSGWTSPHGPRPFAAADRVCVAVPLTLAAEPVAVLYADRPASDASLPRWRTLLETLSRHAARALEAITAFRTANHLAMMRAGDEIATMSR